MRPRQSNTRAAFLTLLFLLLCPAAARAQLQTPCPPGASTTPTGFVNDYAGVVDAASKERIDAVLTNLRDRAQVEFTVVTVRTTGAQPPFDYSLALARCWGVGSKTGDRAGLLLLVAVDDRKAIPQVSRHLEGDLPDGLITTILQRTLPEPFRAGDYGRGITDAVLTIVATLADKRGFSIEGIDQRYVYRPQPQRQRPVSAPRGSLGLGGCCLIAIVGIIILGLISRGGRGGRGGRRGGGWGGGGGGLLQAIILGQILGNLGSGGRRSSGWGGGGGGSSGWGGGGGGGGFGGFGGGGDFGGGGGPGVSW